MEKMIQPQDLGQISETCKPKITINGVEYILHHSDCEDLQRATYFILENEEGERVIHHTAYGIAQNTERKLRASGLGPYIDFHTFANFKTPNKWQQTIKNQAQKFVSNPKGWFVILGQSGSGKTMICNAIAIELMRQGKTLEYMLWFDEVNKMKWDMQHNEAYITKLKYADILYIDDFLKTRSDTSPTDIEVELAYQILDTRYRSRKITIISGEKTLSQIQSYDTAVFGRIIEMAKDNLISLGLDESKNVRMQI